MTIESNAGERPAREKSISISRAWARAAIAASALCAAAASPSGASAQEVCVSQAAKTTLSQCPAGVTKPVPGKKGDLPIKAPPPPPAPKSAATPRTPDPTPGQGPRDDRRIRSQARANQLLVTQIQQLDVLSNVTINWSFFSAIFFCSQDNIMPDKGSLWIKLNNPQECVKVTAVSVIVKFSCFLTSLVICRKVSIHPLIVLRYGVVKPRTISVANGE